MDSHEVYMDPIITHSSGVWSDVPAIAVNQLRELDIDPMAAVHAACEYKQCIKQMDNLSLLLAHCFISMMPRFISPSSVNLKTECKNPHATRPRPIRYDYYSRKKNKSCFTDYQCMNLNHVVFQGNYINFSTNSCKHVYNKLKNVAVKMVVLHVKFTSCVGGFNLFLFFLGVGIHLSNCSEHNQVCSKKGALIIFHTMINYDANNNTISSHNT